VIKSNIRRPPRRPVRPDNRQQEPTLTMAIRGMSHDTFGSLRLSYASASFFGPVAVINWIVECRFIIFIHETCPRNK